MIFICIIILTTLNTFILMSSVNTKASNLVEKPSFKTHYDNFIGGKWVAPTKGQYFETISPVDGQVFTKVARSTEEDINLALVRINK